MSDTVIDVQNISKLYRLGKIGSGSLRRDVAGWWHKTVSKKVENASSKNPNERAYNAQDLWALRDVSFTLKEGEALGIIGSNGSGKSTLLKIISRIVQPTNGFVRGKGKISSILEVGTGFHHELSGRENIYISGYTLGMNKAEIRRKFDEIVSFSGIERFIDTPVKRYSSGMYVRLAFAVAAHLEPDILIVDEVLAVGDADFQKKCMGKMQDISDRNGRTIIFVSHSMPAITNLCTKALWLQQGALRQVGTPSDVVQSYLKSLRHDKIETKWEHEDTAPGNEMIRMRSISVRPAGDDQFITVRTPITLTVEFSCFTDDFNININVKLFTPVGELVFDIGSPVTKAEKGTLVLSSTFPGDLLNNSTYNIGLTIVKNVSEPICEFPNCATFDVEDVRENISYYGHWPGIIRPILDTTLKYRKLTDALPN